MESTPISVSECVALVNQTLEYAFPVLLIEGEVAEFKVNKSKYVFFKLKDDDSTLDCFMMIYQLRQPIEDGMRIRVIASPRLTAWGKFSMTVREIRPVGEGSIKRSFELLRAKLAGEGLFDEARKRLLPQLPGRIGLITSTEAAGYIDFVKILNERWGGMDVLVANVQVQGLAAPEQMIKAIEHFNQMAEPVDALVIVRGGGSADDLSAFNDEPLVRTIAASRIPTMVGVGHEVDISLSDLAADVRAATPSNAAQLLVPDRRELLERINYSVHRMLVNMQRGVDELARRVTESEKFMIEKLIRVYETENRQTDHLILVLKQLSPEAPLKRGYAIVRTSDGQLVRGTAGMVKAQEVLTIETQRAIIEAGARNVKAKE